MDETVKKYLSELGKKGGSMKSESKAEAAKENGKKGGRPTNEELDIEYERRQKIIRKKYSDLTDGIDTAYANAIASKWEYGVDLLNNFVEEMKKLGFSEKDFDRLNSLSKFVLETNFYRPNIDGKYRTYGPFKSDTGSQYNQLCDVFVGCFNDS